MQVILKTQNINKGKIHQIPAQKYANKSDLWVYASYLNTKEADRSLWVQARLFSLHDEIQYSYDYIGRPCLKKPNPTNQRIKHSLTSQSKNFPEYNDSQRKSYGLAAMQRAFLSGRVFFHNGLMEKTPWNTVLKTKTS